MASSRSLHSSCFSPCTPCGVRRDLGFSDRDIMEFQSTHSLRSATAGRSRRSPGGCGFNPRTPCGVRLLSKIPLGGYGRFNPRTPRGVRPLRAVFAGRFRRFQSTHSLRSATPVVADLAAFEVVSIHALLAECDKGGSHEPGSTGSFNPRTPCGVRLLVDVIRISNAEVSIHALLAECDPFRHAGTVRVYCFNPRTPCGVRRLADGRGPGGN